MLVKNSFSTGFQDLRGKLQTRFDGNRVVWVSFISYMLIINHSLGKCSLSKGVSLSSSLPLPPDAVPRNTVTVTSIEFMLYFVTFISELRYIFLGSRASTFSRTMKTHGCYNLLVHVLDACTH